MYKILFKSGFDCANITVTVAEAKDMVNRGY